MHYSGQNIIIAVFLETGLLTLIMKPSVCHATTCTCMPKFNSSESNLMAANIIMVTLMFLIRKAVKELFNETERNAKETDIATSVSWEDLPEDGYFGMYTHFSIHEIMLKVHVLAIMK